MIVADNWLPLWRSLAVFQFGALRGLNSSDECSHTLWMCQTEQENHWDSNWQDGKMWVQGRERQRGRIVYERWRQKERGAAKFVSPCSMFAALCLKTDSFKSLWSWEMITKKHSHNMIHIKYVLLFLLWPAWDRLISFWHELILSLHLKDLITWDDTKSRHADH